MKKHEVTRARAIARTVAAHARAHVPGVMWDEYLALAVKYEDMVDELARRRIELENLLGKEAVGLAPPKSG